MRAHSSTPPRLDCIAAIAAVCLLCATGIGAQAPARQAPARPAQAVEQAPPIRSAPEVPAITEEELRQQLVGKTFYLRGGWLDNDLHFGENGKLDGTSPKGSFALCLVEITQVHLKKHRLELEGNRYGVHFLGALPTEEQTGAFDKVRLTPKKKPLRITIDREAVEKPKKEKPPKKQKKQSAQTTAQKGSGATAAQVPTIAPQEKSAETMHTVADANRALRSALDRIFSSGMDAHMIESLPEYWQLYYKAVDSHADYRTSDPTVMRQSQVDRKAKLVSAVEPPSNDYAQKNGVAGVAMYHVIVGPDGKAEQVAVGRPIGFGLDENAVAAIHKAAFEPAMKDGKPVPVLLDLLVEFRIYSKRTAEASSAPPLPAQAPGPILPGPYSVNKPKGP